MFSVKQAIDDADLAPFPFQDADGNTRELPHLKLLSPNQGVRALNGDLKVLAEIGIDEDLAEALADWPSHVIESLLMAWMKHSDVQIPGGEPGKSPKSLPSSPNTAPRSRRTSGSGASRSRR